MDFWSSHEKRSRSLDLWGYTLPWKKTLFAIFFLNSTCKTWTHPASGWMHANAFSSVASTRCFVLVNKFNRATWVIVKQDFLFYTSLKFAREHIITHWLCRNGLSYHLCVWYVVWMCKWTFDVWYMMEGWPVESLCCLQTHIGLPGPGQSAVGVQDLTETSLLTVFHDDEELRAGSCRRRHSQNHVSLMFKTKINPATRDAHRPGHWCQTFAGCWATQTASWSPLLRGI